MTLRQHTDEQDGGVAAPVTREVASEEKPVRAVELARGLVTVLDLVRPVARRDRERDEQTSMIRNRLIHRLLDEKVADPLPPAIGPDRHPGDLGRVVEVRLERQKADDTIVVNDEATLCPNRVRAAGPSFDVTEVVRQRLDDLIARGGVATLEWSYGDPHFAIISAAAGAGACENRLRPKLERRGRSGVHRR